MRRCGIPKAIHGAVGDYIGDAPSSAECALSQPRTVRQHGKSARSHNGGDVYSFGGPHNVPSLVAGSSTLPGIELHPVFVVYQYSHRTVQTSSESKPGVMARFPPHGV